MRVRLRNVAGAVVATLVTGLLAGVPANAVGATGTVGAPGIGDPYYPLDGNGGYDVAHYALDLSYEPTTDVLSGTTVVFATATQDLSRFNFDFLLTPRDIRVNGRPATFVSDPNGELIVTPARTVRRGAPLVTTVSYSDVPSNHQRYGHTAWKHTADGVVAIGQPHIAPWWYPANDHPLDKATYDVSVSVPAGLTAVSNGLLSSSGPDAHATGRTRWHWRSSHPQGTYQTSMIVGRMRLERRVPPDGIPFIAAYHEDLVNGDLARADVDRTPEFVDFLSSKFGPYPFEAQGGTVVLGWAGLENQTRPTYGDNFWTSGPKPALIVHEMAHQWFANSVSVRHWRDSWLAEGFATYAEWLWSEHNGTGTAAQHAQAKYDLYAADRPFWQLVVADPGPFDTDNPATAAVYFRGAMALQSLRTTVGDDMFLRILRSWAAAKRYGNASTEEFMAFAERVSGRQLDEVFHTWLYYQGKPSVGPNDPVS